MSFEEIKKLVAQIKRGVVVVEDGEPSYVIVPFKDFEEMRMRVEGGAWYADVERLKKAQTKQPIDDTSLIQKMIGYEGAFRSPQTSSAESEVVEMLNAMDKEKERGKGRERPPINLEDLPF